MRFTKLFTVALATAAIAVSGATADPGHGHGKPEKTGANCKPKVMLVMTGMLTATPAATDAAFSLKVAKANHHGHALVGQTLSVSVDAKTRYLKAGQQVQLKDLALNDNVLVQARACKADLKAAKGAATMPSLTARKVVVKAPEASKAEKSAR